MTIELIPETPPTDPTPPADPAAPAPDPPEPLKEGATLAEHAAKFGPGRTSAGTERGAEVTPDDDESGRDAQGRFKGRHRAARQQATAADVPRINELTAKLRAAEAERDALKHAPPPPLPPSTPSDVAPARPTAAPTKPQPADFPDYEQYLDARDTWNRAQWTAEEQQRQETQRITASWNDRVNAAMAAHPDFDAVALKAPTKIPAGSLMDAWILESAAGAEILYALQANEPERARIAALSPVLQAEALALLGHALTTPPAPPVSASPAAPPRPPTPIRTGPMKGPDEVPGDEADLRTHAKIWGPRRERR